MLNFLKLALKIFAIVAIFSVILAMAGLAMGLIKYENKAIISQQEAREVTLNLCETDGENADYWQQNRVNLFEFPNGGGSSFKLPACQSLQLEVLEKRSVDNIENYLVKYKDSIGWQTKRLLTGEE